MVPICPVPKYPVIPDFGHNITKECKQRYCIFILGYSGTRMLKIWAILAVLVLVFPLVACEERKGCGNLTYQNYTEMYCTKNIVFWGHGVDAVSAIQLNEWPVKEVSDILV